MKHPDAKQRYSLVEPLQMRQTNQMSSSNGQHNNDKIAKRKVPESDSDSDSDSDDEVPLSLLTNDKPQNSKSSIPEKRQPSSTHPKTQPSHSRVLHTKDDSSNKRLALHDLRNQSSATKTSRQNTDRKSKQKTVQTKLSFFAVQPKQETSQSSQSTATDISLRNETKASDSVHRMKSSAASQDQTPSLTDDTSNSLAISTNDIATESESTHLQDSDDNVSPKTKEEEAADAKTEKKKMRRIVSSESADVDFEPVLPTPTRGSLLTQLYLRESRGSRIPPRLAQPKKWKSPSWVRLAQPPCAGGHQPGSRKIEHLAWDPMGVLLAVAAHSTIRIYDWDMVRAAHLQGKKDQQQSKKRKRDEPLENSEFVIPPVLQFRVPHAVASLKWNPFNEDQLLVGYRMTGEVHIYNVDRLATWQSKNPRNLVSLPHESTYWNLSHPRTKGSASAILVLDPTTVLVSLGAMVHCWKLSKGRKSSMLWRYQPPANVTCACKLGTTFVLLGTNRGHLCLLNWRKWNNERAFSTEKKPLVMQEWIPHASLRTSLNQEQRGRMGIVDMKIETSCSTFDARTATKSSESQTNSWGSCRISWVTVSGWLMSTVITSPDDKSAAQISRATDMVRYKNSDGTFRESTRQEYSQPHDPIAVCTNSKWICWSNVPAVTIVLPHHDKRVLDGQHQILRSDKRSIHYRDGGSTHTIKLTGKTAPQSFAMHPDREWIAMGVGANILLLVGRS